MQGVLVQNIGGWRGTTGLLNMIQGAASHPPSSSPFISIRVAHTLLPGWAEPESAQETKGGRTDEWVGGQAAGLVLLVLVSLPVCSPIPPPFVLLDSFMGCKKPSWQAGSPDASPPWGGRGEAGCRGAGAIPWTPAKWHSSLGLHHRPGEWRWQPPPLPRTTRSVVNTGHGRPEIFSPGSSLSSWLLCVCWPPLSIHGSRNTQWSK